jgi:cell division protein FtsN
VSGGNRRLTSRDYKGARGSGMEWHRWRGFAGGLAAGLTVALIVYVTDHRHAQNAEVVTPTATRKAAAANPDPAPISASTETEYSFYDRLPNFEVTVPEKERTARVDNAARVVQPGTYFLQVGSYREQAEAERIRSQLARLNITASVQRVAVDNDVWHRVRVGPIKDLEQLNKTRAQLKAADLNSLVVKLEQ